MTDPAHNPFPDDRMAMRLCGQPMRCRPFTMKPANPRIPDFVSDGAVYARG